MTTAYTIGYIAGGLTSALVISRIVFWVTRYSLRGWTRALVANGVSFLVIVAVSVIVRHGVEWQAIAFHLVAQALWLVVDLAFEKREP